MFEKGALLFLYTLTPLHAGAGQELGFVDLPLQRERITGFPIIQASEIKGKLRSLAALHPDQDNDWSMKVAVTFGPEKERASEHAGCISVSDARILLFPVRSLKGVFAWVTCEEVLARFLRDAKLVGEPPFDEIHFQLSTGDVAVSGDSILDHNGKVVLEEFSFRVNAIHKDDVGKRLAQGLCRYLPKQGLHVHFVNNLSQRLAVLPNDSFRYFVQYATEVVTRTALETEKKVVKERALWNEEYLPSETILYALCLVSKPRAPKESLPSDWGEDPSAKGVLDFVKELIHNRCFQLGGDETTGKGIVAAFMYPPPADKSAQQKERGGE